MLESLIAAVTPFRPGWIELPEAYGATVWGLTKGRLHKYIKRVPKTGGGYRYYYNVAHGGGVHHADHFVEGASFRHGEGHYHITHASGDSVTIKHDESGHTHTLSKAELGKTLREHHASALKSHHEKASRDLADAKAAGASQKQIAKLEGRVKTSAPSREESSLERFERERREAQPRLEAIKALEADAVAPVSHEEASSVDPKSALDDLFKLVHWRELVDAPVRFSSSEDASGHHSKLWPKESGSAAVVGFKGGKKWVSGIAVNVGATKTDSGKTEHTGTLRPPQTPAEFAAVAEDVIGRAKTDLDARTTWTSHHPGAMDRREELARAQRLATVLKAHARVAGGLPAADEVDTHRSAAQARGLKLERGPNGHAYVSGPGTFENKDKIKAAGGRWDGRNTWTVPASNLGAMLKGAPSSWL